MKPIYKSLTLAAMTLQVSVALQAQVNDGTTASQIDVPAEVLDSLRVELVAPNVSGARDLIKSGECTVSGNDLSISLNAGDWLKGGMYRLQVIATFGTQTQVIYALDVTVPRYETLASEPQEYEDTVTVVSTYGDGDKSGADASVYAKDGDGNAHITTPLSISDGVANGDGSIASGYVNGEGATISAGGAGATAIGSANDIYGNVSASGQASQAFGMGTQTQTNGQMVLGKCNVVDTDGDYALIVGNGADDDHRSNAFAIDWNGNLVLFNAGTPVVLTPAKLATLIA